MTQWIMKVFNARDAKLLQHLRGYSGGEFLSSTESTISVIDPATQTTIADVPSYGAAETTVAINQAEHALREPQTLEERRRLLQKIAAAHAEHREELAHIITAENGKPLAEARGEVDYAAGFYSEAASQLDCLLPHVVPRQPRGHRWTVFKRPAGVAGLIVPWNFPLAMLAKKAAAALAAGCAIVVKPSEKTPLSSIALFHILHQLSLPRGLVNLVIGKSGPIGKVLCEHPAVRVISFTGSTKVGKLLSEQAAPHIKRMALELGGNAPFVVFDDADLEHAAAELMSNKFRCSGQTCVCANRVHVQGSIAEKFAQLLAPKIAGLRMGPGADPNSELGPLMDQTGFAKVQELVDDAIALGAQVKVGGTADHAEGLFYPPTLLGSVPPQARCLKEEIFGPVITLVPFENEEEAEKAANDTEYGLAAYVFTKNEERGTRFIQKLRFGHVGLNTGTGPVPQAPFGGMRQSGLGREGSSEGIFEFVELQTVPTPP